MPLFFLLQIDAAESTVDRIEDWALDQGLTIVSIVIFAIIAMIALNIIVPRLVRLSTETELGGKSQVEIEKRTKTLTHVFTRTGTTLIVVMGFITILPELGVNIGPLLAGLGIAGIALGFGAQNLVKDVISGVFMLTDNQYSTGDVVEVAGKTGVVEDVGLRRTVLRDLDGVERARGEPLRIGAKALVIKTDGVYRLFVLPADRRVDSQAIKHRLGFKKLRFADAAELLELTGLVPGSVPPFGPPVLDLPLVAVPAMLENDRVARPGRPRPPRNGDHPGGAKSIAS